MSIGVLKSICVDFSDESLYQYITVFSEEIYSRTIEITPLNNGEEYIIPAETTARLEARKPDNKPILLDSKIDFTNNKIYIELTPKCLDTPGVTSCQIGLYGVDNRFIASSYFYIDVYRSALSGNGSVNHPGCNSNVVESSPEYQSFRVALLSVDEVQKRANAAILKAENDISNAIQNMDVEIDDAVNKISESAEEAIENAKETNESVSKNELERKENETQRQQNEQLRDAAEEDRKKDFEAMVTDFGNLGGIAVSNEEPESERVVAWIDPSDDEKTLFMTSDDITQELGNDPNKVLSQKAATENVVPNSFASGNIGLTPKPLHTNGGYHLDASLFGMSTDKIPCTTGDVFIYRGRGELETVSAQFFNDDEFIGYKQISSITIDREIIIPENANFVRFSSYSENEATFVFEVRKKYSHLVGNLPQVEKKIKDHDENFSKLGEKISEQAEAIIIASITAPEDMVIIEHNENLFVKTDSRIIKDHFMSGLTVNPAVGLHITHPIKVNGGVTYKYARNGSFGSNNAYHVVDKKGDFLSYGMGTYVDGFYTFTPEKDCYVILNISNLDNTVIAPVDNYPENYVEGKRVMHGVNIPVNNVDDFAETIAILTNPLYGKKITVNGDSICAGAGYTGGYAKIIGENNNMTVQNIGVGGGTITAEQYYTSNGNARHWICRTISNMDETADYAIVEGGVNDSAIGVPLGEITSDYASELDDTTFYGAFENMLKQLITRFADKKYGYIAVHQMTAKFRANNTPETSFYYAAKKCCEKWGVPFLDLNTGCPPFDYFDGSASEELQALRTTYTKDGDGWHPNKDGYEKYYVPKIEAWMKTL